MFSSLPGYALIIIYIVLAIAICFLSKKLGDYVDALDKKTNISGAFIGGVLLAAVTSLPELFTSISATILLPSSSSLVIGNILGSNLFNLAIMGLCILIFLKKFITSTFEFKSHFTVIISCLFIYNIIAYGLLAYEKFQPIAGPINFLSLVILLIYGISIMLQPKEKDEEEEKIDNYKLSKKQIIIRFIICAIILVGASIFITYDTDALSNYYSIDQTLAGAIFLAIATSLPELVSTFTLCYKGNFNAGLGDITGSCLFNFCIIGLAEFMSYRTSLLPGFSSMAALDTQAVKMLLITIVVMVILLGVLFYKSKSKKTPTIQWYQYLLYGFLGVVLLGGYVLFLVI